MKEIWRSIKDYPDYKVSNRGRVRSLKFNRAIFLKLIESTDYCQVDLCKDCSRKKHSVHILVAEAFIGPKPSEGHVCNHKDGIKLNNDVDNLEWITRPEDVQHSYNSGLHLYNLNSYSWTRLKNGEVWLIKKLLSYNISQRKIAKMFKVSRGCIVGISTGRSWSYITL